MWNLSVVIAKGYQRVVMIQMQKKKKTEKERETAFNLTSGRSDAT